MPTPVYFSKVKKAREALQIRAFELVKLYMSNLKAAKRAGNHEVVAEGIEWLLEHMPADEDGVKVLEQSIDKPRDSQANLGPSINIGFSLGGIPQKELPPSPQIIDITPDNPEDSK